jgi:hypothetical protein
VEVLMAEDPQRERRAETQTPAASIDRATGPATAPATAPPAARTRPRDPAPVESSSVSGLRGRFGQRAVPAGEVVGAVLAGHAAEYVDGSIASGLADLAATLAPLGPTRTIAGHLDIVATRWDAARVPVHTGRHVVLALSLDPGVGDALVPSGVVASMLRIWRPGRGTPEEPYRLVWDALSAGGRDLTEAVPLLAAAFGAPAEVSAEIPGTEPLRAMAWSPAGDRLAVLAGDTVQVVRPGPGDEGSAYLLGTVGPGATSVGWGGRDVVGLVLRDDLKDVVRVADGSSLGGLSDVVAGVLSGNGASAWVLDPTGIQRLVPGVNDPPQPVFAPVTGTVAAVDHPGRYALLRLPDGDALVGDPATVSPPPSASPPPPSAEASSTPWPPDAAPLVWRGPPAQWLAAILSIGDEPTVAYATADGVEVRRPLSSVAVCRIATGPGEVTAMAVDPSGTRLAVAAGRGVRVWSLAASRATSTPVPAYDSDRSSGGRDLLTSDRDADAIAALVSASDLRPPLSIGLFGAWGSGKSFILDQVTARLDGGGRGAGYLQHIRVVSFNAWHYAEADLWASLVDQVLRVIAPRKPDEPPEVTAAADAAVTARAAATKAADDVAAAERELTKAREALAKRRRRAAYLAAFLLVLAAIATVAVIIRGIDRNIAAIAAALALLSSAAGVLARARTAGEQAKDLANAGRTGIAVVGRVIGRPEELAVRTRAEELRRTEEAKARADVEADRLEAARASVQEIADDQPLGVLLNRLATVSEYRDKLSLVTRTRSYFSTVDREVRAARNARAAAVAATASADTDAGGPELERIVIIIDDLDRCPPEKVVAVLEAVHLLFDFELFVVLIAVDTRWLEQSLQIHYRRLLGRPGTARPTDYLEKIIQVPLHLPPLDESMVRSVIAGLTGTRRRVPEPRAGAPVGAVTTPGPATEPATTSGPLTATTPRARRGPLPAEVMRISPREADAMSTVAALVGTTPRTAKRFVNTYRLLKARAADPSRFDRPGPVTVAPRGRPTAGLGDHEVVAFLLAVVTGRPQIAQTVLRALLEAPPRTTAQQAVASVVAPADNLASVAGWLATHQRFGQAPAQRYAPWVQEVSRFSFAPLA